MRVPLRKWPQVHFGAKFAVIAARTKRNPGFKAKDERTEFYENESKTLCLGPGYCRFHE
jgi:hypothetical protein